MIVAGVGVNSRCDEAELTALVRRTEAAFGRRAACVSTLDRKAGREVTRAAAALGLPLVPVPAAALRAVQSRCLTQSPQVERAVGVASVAEACALAVAGEGGRLLGPRLASAHATCALAYGSAR